MRSYTKNRLVRTLIPSINLFRAAAFSRQMSLFFKYHINGLLQGLWVSIVYASGVILKEVRSGEMSRHDVFSCMTLMGLAHAIIEDTCLMLLIGAHIGGIFFLRLALAFVTCAVINILYLRFRGDAREPETAPNEVS